MLFGWNLPSLVLFAQDAASDFAQMKRDGEWWGKLGNVMFGAVVVLLVIVVVLGFWRRSVNKKTDRKAKVDEILTEEIVKNADEPT